MDSRLARAWFSESEDSWGATLFLVRAPITFGHSELVLRCDAADEANQFAVAAMVIRKALAAFKEALTPKTLRKFDRLAAITATHGSYIKTLILRVSADEDEGREYKVHLVPYFQSHAFACQQRYVALHGNPPAPAARGGLLAWLGERDTIVDSWQNADAIPFTEQLDDIAIDRLHLDDLAAILRCSMTRS